MGTKCILQYPFGLQGSLTSRRVGRSLTSALRISSGKSSLQNSSSYINLCIVYILCRNLYILMSLKISFIVHIHSISRSFRTLHSTSVPFYSYHFLSYFSVCPCQLCKPLIDILVCQCSSLGNMPAFLLLLTHLATSQGLDGLSIRGNIPVFSNLPYCRIAN